MGLTGGIVAGRRQTSGDLDYERTESEMETANQKVFHQFCDGGGCRLDGPVRGGIEGKGEIDGQMERGRIGKERLRDKGEGERPGASGSAVVSRGVCGGEARRSGDGGRQQNKMMAVERE